MAVGQEQVRKATPMKVPSKKLWTESETRMEVASLPLMMKLSSSWLSSSPGKDTARVLTRGFSSTDICVWDMVVDICWVGRTC